jgi:hypothetical protein
VFPCWPLITPTQRPELTINGAESSKQTVVITLASIKEAARSRLAGNLEMAWFGAELGLGSSSVSAAALNANRTER